MANTTTEKVGVGRCPSSECGKPVVYRKSKGGMLKHRCEYCDSAGYAEPGGLAYKARMATITVEEPAAPETAPATTTPAKKNGLLLDN